MRTPSISPKTTQECSTFELLEILGRASISLSLLASNLASCWCRNYVHVATQIEEETGASTEFSREVAREISERLCANHVEAMYQIIFWYSISRRHRDQHAALTSFSRAYTVAFGKDKLVELIFGLNRLRKQS